jgi:hypothetical protein
MSDAATLSILIDVKTRLEELTKLNQGIRQAKEESSSFGTILKQGLGIGTGIQMATAAVALFKATIVGAIRDSFNLATEIKNNSQALGISGEAYQVLKDLVEETGGEVTNLTQAISFNNQSLVEAAKGTGSAAAAYRGLGLDVQQLAQAPVEKRFELIGRAILNSKDQTKAYGEAAQIVGSRNIRFLMNALQELAKDGYGKIDDAMVKSGKIMSDDTTARLAAAQLQIKKAKDLLTTGTGEALGLASKVLESYKKDFWGTLQAAALPMMGIPYYEPLARAVAKNSPDQALPEPPKNPTLPTPLRQTAEWRSKELEILKAENDEAVIQADNLITEAQQRTNLLPIISRQVQGYEDLLEQLKKAPLEDTETQADRDAMVEKLNAKIRILQKRLNEAYAGPKGAEQISRERFQNIENPSENRDFISAKGGFFTGVQDWASSLGSKGQQISSMMQNTIGTAVSGISQGIDGWITGTEKWGDSLRNIGSNILQAVIQAIVQMGVQWVVTQIMMAVVGKALNASTTAALKPIAAEQAAIWAPAATLATIASWGGAAAAAPWEIAASIGLTEGISAGFAGAKEGGFYPGDEDSVAGVFHGNEFIFSAPATRALGPQNLASMHDAALAGSIGNSGTFPGGGRGSSSGRPVKVFNFWDRRAMVQEINRDPSHEAHIVDVMRRHRGDILET